jgi:hypothetical protein
MRLPVESHFRRPEDQNNFHHRDTEVTEFRPVRKRQHENRNLSVHQVLLVLQILTGTHPRDQAEEFKELREFE